MLYIGVDLGTSAVKLLLMNEQGGIEKIVSREYPLSFPHSGWSQQNPYDWYVQTIDGLKELLSECDRSQVDGISFGGQMHGLVTLDEQDEVVRPAILWNDGRTTEETAYLNNVIGRDKLTEYTAKGKIIAGAADNAAAAGGTGTVGANHCNLSLGTSGTLFVSSDKFGVDEHNALHSFAHADGGYHLMGCMLSAASCNKWWMDEILKTKDYAGEQKGITTLGENQVFYLPYLMGERSPHNNPDARAMFVGMSMDTTREDMTLAVLEGVAFGLRDSLEVARSLGIRIDSSRICGGGAKSPLWRQIIAAVMNVKLEIIESDQGPGYGAAILAAVGCGTFDSVEHACAKLVKVIDTVDPDPELVQKYEEKYQKFRQLYPIMKDWF